MNRQEYLFSIWLIYLVILFFSTAILFARAGSGVYPSVGMINNSNYGSSMSRQLINFLITMNVILGLLAFFLLIVTNRSSFRRTFLPTDLYSSYTPNRCQPPTSTSIPTSVLTESKGLTIFAGGATLLFLVGSIVNAVYIGRIQQERRYQQNRYRQNRNNTPILQLLNNCNGPNSTFSIVLDTFWGLNVATAAGIVFQLLIALIGGVIYSSYG